MDRSRSKKSKDRTKKFKRERKEVLMKEYLIIQDELAALEEEEWDFEILPIEYLQDLYSWA